MTLAPRAAIAVVVGIGDYRHAERIAPLRFATRDARAVAETLTNPAVCQFPPNQVVLLSNHEATRDQIVHRLSNWLPTQGRGTELAFIYFAGHGMVHTLGGHEEGYLLAHDTDPDDLITRGVAMSDVAHWIDAIQAKAVVVCLDCCHAGKVLAKGGAHREGTRDMELRPSLLAGMAGTGRFLIASCNEGQRSFESTDLGHGLFTYHLLQGMAGAADRDGDGQVSVAELFAYVSRAVAHEARTRFQEEQTPWTTAVYSDEVYLSRPRKLAPSEAVTVALNPQDTTAVLEELEAQLPHVDPEELRRALETLRQRPDRLAVPLLFRCLTHQAEGVRDQARRAIHALGWSQTEQVIQALARQNDSRMGDILEGFAAFEAHPDLVHLLDRLVDHLRGDLRHRAILLLERKRLSLELEKMVDLFREIRSPYQLQRVLGQGLCTAAYLARMDDTELDVVVRVLRPELATQPRVRTDFHDLTKKSVQFVHQNLVLTREARAFPDRGIYFAVRDYIDGVTLQKVLEGGKRFTPLQVVQIVRQLLGALMPVHQRGLAHGAIKPSNIFLRGSDQVILGDPSVPIHGLGVTLDRLCYDYRYVAPESLRGASPGPPADLYSIGCVAYELLCGEPPFVADSYQELTVRHLRDDIIPVSQRGQPPCWEEYLRWLLARDEKDRFADIYQAGEELLRVQQIVTPATPSVAAAPLLRDASLQQYQSRVSIVPFEPGKTVDEAAPINPETLKSAGLPQIPGYEVLEILGRGGMGVVYKARHLLLNRVVAIKVLPLGVTAADSLSRFHREAQSVAGLTHPNIVRVYDLGQFQGQWFISLEYVEGGTLSEVVRQGPLPPQRVAELMLDLARAIHHAHQHGIIHRDLKPSNVLLDSSGLAKIGDFGLAKSLEQPEMKLTMVGQIMGTPAYMAPEQATGKAGYATPQSDIYSLGTIFYEMLTGSSPFKAESVGQMLMKVMLEPPTPPHQLNPNVDRQLEIMCLKCLEKDPARRYQTAQALADELAAWLRGEAPVGVPVPEPPVSLWKRLFQRFRGQNKS